jgi:hypothetical protein
LLKETTSKEYAEKQYIMTLVTFRVLNCDK